MIPESEGATPFGIFLLADSYFQAANATDRIPALFSNGPIRLLCYHACELFLKCYLRHFGEGVDTLRGYGHNLHNMALSAQKASLSLPHDVLNTLSILSEKNDYVRVRYMVIDIPGDIKPKTIIATTQKIRECVRLALNMDEFGNPLS